MSVLSEWDIINELGRGLFIYPFRGMNKSIKGCCLCLTASRYAYTFDVDAQTGKQKENRLEIKINPGNQDHFFILIPKRKTAVIWTQESVRLENYLCGSIHSTVTLVSKGIGHLGTRVNPSYGGVMAIALHNLSDEDIKIDVGKNDEDGGEIIAYLRIHRLSSKSSVTQSEDEPGKIGDMPAQPEEVKKWLREKWRTGNKSAIARVLESSPDFKEAKTELANKSIRYRLFFKYLPQWDTSIWVQIIIAGVTAIGVIVAIMK